jgi:hypothetical protein
MVLEGKGIIKLAIGQALRESMILPSSGISFPFSSFHPFFSPLFVGSIRRPPIAESSPLDEWNERKPIVSQSTASGRPLSRGKLFRLPLRSGDKWHASCIAVGLDA